MAFVVFASLLLLACLILYSAYIRINDTKLLTIPDRALALSPHRCSPEDVLKTSERLKQNAPLSVNDQVPPKTGRRYIVVGGAGFLGGWIVLYLIKRGEHPSHIRVIDIRKPTRKDLLEGPAAEVDYRPLDMSDAAAVDEAFKDTWPIQFEGDLPPITVFHTAANIRFFERHPDLLPLSTKVNVEGTQHILDSARAIGAETLVYTSSGAVSVRSSQYLLSLWQKEPRNFVQVMNEDDALVPKRHEDFFSNYTASKWQAEKRVRAADKSQTAQGDKKLRTGCIRPGNGVFGPGGDMLCAAYLVRKTNPTWMRPIVESFIYVENCALAHLLYECRLIDIANLPATPENPDIGGRAFIVSDPGVPPTSGDVYTVLETLTDGDTTFPDVSPTLLLMIAYVLEAYYLMRYFLVISSSRSLAWIGSLLPPLGGDVVNLQPSIFNLTMPHLIFDDSRARLPPSKGGLGYKGAWTTLEALHKTVDAHKAGSFGESHRSDTAGINLSFGRFRTQKAAAKLMRDGVPLTIDAAK